MNENQPELEVAGVPEAIGLPLEDFDLVVEAVERNCRESVVEVGQEAVSMSSEVFWRGSPCA